MSDLIGHDEEAVVVLDRLLEAYRRSGLPGIRAALAEHDLTGPELDAVVTEAVFRLASATSRSMTARRSWEHFDADEAMTEQDAIARGGNRR